MRNIEQNQKVEVVGKTKDGNPIYFTPGNFNQAFHRQKAEETQKK